jgi:hypothetical protein
MGRTHTHTVAELELSHAAYDEIKIRLEQAGYRHVFGEDGMIDMTGIGVTRFSAARGLKIQLNQPSRTRIGDDPHDRTVGQLEQELADGEVHRLSANERQVGGTHYGLGTIQHWDLAVMFGWNWAQYQITRYVMRYRAKNGLQDLEKAEHFIQKLIEEIRAGRMPERDE